MHAVFYLFETTGIENLIQVTIDLLTTEDGKIAKNMPSKGPEKHIPIYSVVNDYFFPG